MRRVLLPLVLLGCPAVAVSLLLVTGGLGSSEVTGLADPGAATRWSLPVVQAVRDLSAAFTVGTLVLVATCVPPAEEGSSGTVTGTRERLADLAFVGSGVWATSSVGLLILGYSDAAGVPLSAPGLAQGVAQYTYDFTEARYQVYGATLAAIAGLVAWAAQRTVALGLAAAVSVVALWPIALTGHASSARDHNTAVDLQLWHLLGIGVWVGGLLALVACRARLGPDLLPTVRRFSVLAGWCLALTAGSGLLAAWLRLPAPSALMSSYGALLSLKVAALGMLAAAGWRQRHRAIAALAAGRSRSFARLVSGEVLVMAMAVGTGVALSRSAPPPPSGPDVPLTPAQALLGRDLPPSLDAAQWLTAWRPDSFWLPVTIGLALSYAVGIVRLARRGVPWPWGRAAAWLTGCLLLVWSTSGAPGVYGQVLFSMHMVQHMTIALAVPTFLVLGAPVTLAVRVLPRRTDGSMGPREWILSIVTSRVSHLLGHPIVASALFVLSLVTFYYSSLLELSLSTHTGHVLMTAHFLLAGYLFANCLVGVDPGPRRPAFPFRVLLVMVVFGLHALFSVSLMATENVLAENWFVALDRTWGASPAADQETGASLGWALGDYPLAILAGALAVQWVRHDRREQRRFDRNEERAGDSRLTGYNEYLARLGQRGEDDAAT